MSASIQETESYGVKVVRQRSKCLRKRLRGFSCTNCLDNCAFDALYEQDGEIIHDRDKCLGCGVCTTCCSGDAFVADGFDLLQTLYSLAGQDDYILSCNSSCTPPNSDIWIPCVGVLFPESLIFLGIANHGRIRIDLRDCPKCPKHGVAEVFSALFEQILTVVGHLFNSQISLLLESELLSQAGNPNRRSFLISVGSNMAGFIRERILPYNSQTMGSAGNRRRLAVRTKLLLRSLQADPAKCNELLSLCAPDATVASSCTLCPRCKGMCPSGALSIEKVGTQKTLSFNRALCSACGLCTEFCKENALSIVDACIRRRT